MIKLVIFDLDGVLVDACEWHRIALNEALKEISSYEISLEEHYSTFNGIPTKKKLEILVSRGIVKTKDVEKIYKQKQIKTIETISKLCKTRTEKIEMLKYLKSKNIKLACYTNSIRETGVLMLKNTGIFHLFDKFVSNQDVEKPKPDPEGYRKLMNFFDIPKNNTLIIEDSPKGFEAAYKSGARVFRVLNQEHVNKKLFKEFVK